MSTHSKLETEAIKFIIDKTPYGVYKETVNGIRTMVKLESNAAAQSAIKEYEEDHCKQVPLENDKLIIAKVNKDKEGYYNDQSKKYKLMINPLSENFEKLERITAPNPMQVKFDKALLEYREKCFEKEYASTNVFFTVDKDDKWRVHLIISCHVVLPNSKISGEWISNYAVVNSSNDAWVLSGKVAIKAYFYEECNFLFYNNKEIKDDKLAFAKEMGDEQKIGLVINKIEEFENQIQNDINGIYNNFYVDNIKPFRKRLSFAGKKMKWNEIQYSFIDN